MGEWREGNAIPDLLNWVLVESGEGWRWAGVPERAVVNASQLNIAMMEGGMGMNVDLEVHDTVDTHSLYVCTYIHTYTHN